MCQGHWASGWAVFPDYRMTIALPHCYTGLFVSPFSGSDLDSPFLVPLSKQPKIVIVIVFPVCAQPHTQHIFVSSWSPPDLLRQCLHLPSMGLTQSFPSVYLAKPGSRHASPCLLLALSDEPELLSTNSTWKMAHSGFCYLKPKDPLPTGHLRADPPHRAGQANPVKTASPSWLNWDEQKHAPLYCDHQVSSLWKGAICFNRTPEENVQLTWFNPYISIHLQVSPKCRVRILNRNVIH